MTNKVLLAELSNILAGMPPAWYASPAFLVVLGAIGLYVLGFVVIRPETRKRWLMPAAAFGLAAGVWVLLAGSRKIDAPLAARQLVKSVTYPSQWVAVFARNNEWIEVRWVEQLFYPDDTSRWRTSSAIKIPCHLLALCHSNMVWHLAAPISPVKCFHEGDTNIPPFSVPGGWVASSRPGPRDPVAPPPTPKRPDPTHYRNWGP